MLYIAIGERERERERHIIIWSFNCKVKSGKQEVQLKETAVQQFAFDFIREPHKRKYIFTSIHETTIAAVYDCVILYLVPSSFLFPNFLNPLHYGRLQITEMNICIRQLNRFGGKMYVKMIEYIATYLPL